MSELSERYRLAMRSFAATVNIITCSTPDGPCGMTITAVTSLSADPPSILACINTSSAFYAKVVAAERFCINVLARHQADMIAVYASRTRIGERFREEDWAYGPFGPYLRSAQSSVFCRAATRFDHATHAILVGNVEHINVSGTIDPLIYVDGTAARLVLG